MDSTRNRSGSRCAGTVAAIALALLSSGGLCEGADRGIDIRISPESGNPAYGFQVSPEPWCPGDQFPLTVQFAGAPGDRIVGTVLVVSNLEFVPPCTVTAGTGTCTVQDATTLTWDVVADAGGAVGLSAQAAIPANAPTVGQICLAITYTVTPAGGTPGEPITITGCIDYSCPRIPALDPRGRLLLILAVALAAAVALARRPA